MPPSCNDVDPDSAHLGCFYTIFSFVFILFHLINKIFQSPYIVLCFALARSPEAVATDSGE